jgi:hypothetical protein
MNLSLEILNLTINLFVMTKEAIINQTIKAVNSLPQEKANEISDFADFVLMKYEEQQLTNNIQKIVSKSEALNFLNQEEEIYSSNDLKEKYND